MSFTDRWFQPAHASALAVFRIGFGLILLLDMIRYGFHLDIERYYQEPDFLFYYWNLDWIQPLSSSGMQGLYALLAVASLGVTLGMFYRASLLVFIAGFSYTFLLDESRYLNHFYMVWLFAVLMLFMPANRIWSIDSWRQPSTNQSVPAWCYWLLIFQLEVILIYAGLVKLNPDWLALEPLRTWLSYRADMPLVGSLFVQDWAIATAAYGVIALHLLGAPLLLWKPARIWVMLVYAAFHSLNHFVFTIGIFPWMTLFTSLLVFGPDWPLRLWAKIKGQRFYADGDAEQPKNSYPKSHWVIIAIVGWCLFQVLVPLRHFAYPSDVAWSEEGHRFAWRMKLRSKHGYSDFMLHYQNGETQRVYPRQHLNKRQVHRLPCQPDMIWKFAHFLEQHYSSEKPASNPVVAVTTNVFCSLNGRPSQRIVAEDTNLLAVEYDITPTEWILPLTTPLPK
ncbi:HTTM domain-containing protein [Bacterioplanoides sp.]|uniref:HTTM domain-containing protein n=1 Tax=Bacterioplanoides sp. TaxID=2066072 RepID=UPI003AFF8E14